MKKKSQVLLSLLALLIFAGMALAQGNGPVFEVVSEIGRAVPQRVIYDPNFERYAVIDAYGHLALVDALTYATQHVLYENGSYNDLAFSHDGRWLALAIGTRIELWNAVTGELAADLTDLSQARRVHGPLTFSRDDTLLLFFGTYPAPPELRRSENDTITVPWLWSLSAAREEGASTFPRRVEALPFFDYRNGFVLGPDNRIVAALPGRLHVLDAFTTQVVFEISTARYEQDPLSVWFSLRDSRMYVRPVNESSLIQVDTQRGVLVELPLGETLTLNDLETVGGVELSSQARVIGQPNSIRSNPLLEVLLGPDYLGDERWSFHALTVTLIDLLTPPSGDEARLTALLFVYDEWFQRGWFVATRPWDVDQMLLSPDGEHLVLRRLSGGERVEVYNLNTGLLVYSAVPSLRDIGRYSPNSKNRVLAYDATGAVLVTDFQRLDAATGSTLSEDTRYARRFDRFFFTADSAQVVTLGGSEWRLWDVASAEQVRREVLALTGSIVQTSVDGFRYLTRFSTASSEGMEIYDVSTGQRRSARFPYLRGRRIENIIPSPDWEHFLVIYSTNQWGPYYPGNEIALHGIEEGQMWFIAGDDLPGAARRSYGWVDNRTVYVYGEGPADGSDQPGRLNVLDCLAVLMPGRGAEQIAAAWAELATGWPPDVVDEMARDFCQQAQAARAMQTPTPIVTVGLECLLTPYPLQAEAMSADWQRFTDGLSPELATTLTGLLCQAVGDAPRQPAAAQTSRTMMIDIETGERSYGNYAPPGNPRPLEPILVEFSRTERGNRGTIVLSPNAQLVASSTRPGELVIYRLLLPYSSMLANATATAGAYFQQQNLMGALPSPTPTFGLVGTPRPTLTPTITPTPPPPPQNWVDQPQRGQLENLCPSESLYHVEAPAPGYSPTGRILGPVQGDMMWAMEPEDGRRYPDENVPTCGMGLECTLSPDGSWILAYSFDEIYVVRPDGTDWRTLFNEEDLRAHRWPERIWWSGPNTLEYQVYGDILNEPERYGRRGRLLQRDILGVFPDPDPWYPAFRIQDREAEIVALQPGGPLVVARLTFSTGVNPGYEYYLYNRDTRQAVYFARLSEYPEQSLSVQWHPLGDRLFYAYPTAANQRPVWYQMDAATGVQARLGDLPSGVWSPDGRYLVYATESRAQPVGVWDSQTGLLRTYCIPETGARLYQGRFYWAPDSRYLALQTHLPADETAEGVGRHVLVLDLESGSVTDLTFGGAALFMWAPDPAP